MPVSTGHEHPAAGRLANLDQGRRHVHLGARCFVGGDPRGRSERPSPRPIPAALDPATLATIAGLHPIGRLGRAEEVAALTCFLLSEPASFITGSYHLVDGGYVAQ
jgi:NAD(P)-dependent dehydrogenase (short-subunit alcohol dehydrogenase family)